MTSPIIDRFLKYGTLIFTFAFMASVLLQIFARFFLASAPSWTEEASRLFFIYAIAFSAGIAIKGGYYVSLEYFFNLFPSKMQRVLEKIIPICGSLLFGVIAFYSFQFVYLGHQEHSPSMAMSMSIAFFSMVVLFISLCYYSIRPLFQKQR